METAIREKRKQYKESTLSFRGAKRRGNPFLFLAAVCFCALQKGMRIATTGVHRSRNDRLFYTRLFLLAPLCKGSCRGATEGLSRAVLATDSLKIGAGSSSCRTIPPARLTPTHLPLHKGGKILRFTLLFLLRSAPVATLATPQSASLTAPLAGAPRAARVSHLSSFPRIRKRRKGTTLSSSSVFTCSPQH